MGFRVPTKLEWDGVKNATLNPRTSIGTWTAGATEYGSGYKFGNTLFLPAAGTRSSSNGEIIARGSGGFYWSSTEGGTDLASYLNFSSSNTTTMDVLRAAGASVRCIAE